MEYVETDSYVWFEHDTEKFIPCKVLTGGKACGLPLALALQLRAPRLWMPLRAAAGECA